MTRHARDLATPEPATIDLAVGPWFTDDEALAAYARFGRPRRRTPPPVVVAWGGYAVLVCFLVVNLPHILGAVGG